jgi:hypothetical protein
MIRSSFGSPEFELSDIKFKLSKNSEKPFHPNILISFQSKRGKRGKSPQQQNKRREIATTSRLQVIRK